MTTRLRDTTTPPNPPPYKTINWAAVLALVVAQVAYPLVVAQVARPLVTGGAWIVVTIVSLGCLAAVVHAASTRGTRVAFALITVTAAGGFAVEVLGVTTGFPFGRYAYQPGLGPMVANVPLVVPLAWTWMAWPAWVVATALVTSAAGRVLTAGLALASWDLFLDPHMVTAGFWTWARPQPSLPGVPGVPISNYLGWLVVALAMMAILTATAGPRGRKPRRDADAPMFATYLWVYASSILAHVAFLGLPGSAGWGAAGMGLVAMPLAIWLLRSTLPSRAQL